MAILLLGTDFSTRSDRALRRAVLLARQTGCELLIVGVIEEDSSAGSLDTQRREVSALLRRMQQTITDDDRVPCRVEVRIGRPSEQLAEAAQEAGATMMVIGPHQRALIRDAFGTVTAERIVDHSPIPLIAANGVPSGPYRRLLLPVDLEEASRRAARALGTLEFAGSAEIALLHVYDPEAREMLGRAMVTHDEKREYLSERAAAAKEDLRKFAASVGLEHATQLVEESGGPMAADIEQFASEDGADLIVVSRSDKGLIGRSILGSVTEDLLRSGKLDVLVIPSH